MHTLNAQLLNGTCIHQGDRQLRTTYATSPIPHHVPEPLSEITFYMYTARRTPMHVLRREVRSNFRAEEYPST